uniref:ATP synthase F0 subunit 8 n=4 Tax=Coccinellini TaxID=263631 RepID=A0A1B1W5K5_HIPCN|nr:atp8 [Adalia bipunctata]ANW48059.1 atp8 [Cycloneda munda]ANW48069.1 atp8 [Hippodamia tredecimpunctata]ANW48071.1 atp8 [Hippodamia convergens]ARC95496.1 ATP synthase F0 subunit 8 [Hippodamia convergens]
MPQAMPLNWLSLYIIIIMYFLIINISMFFNYKSSPNMKNFYITKKNYWKW